MKEAVRRGASSAAAALLLLVFALAPSRLAVAMRVRGGTFFERVTKAIAGTTLDLSVVLPLVALALLLGVALVTLARRGRPHGLVALLLAAPLSIALYLITVMEQEVKAERGAFTTMHEIVEGLSQASFVGGSLDFVHYERIWMPGLACLLLASALLVVRVRRREDDAPWKPWWAGFAAVLVGAVLLVPILVRAQAGLSTRLSPAALGDPLSSLVETTVDLVRHETPLAPSALLMQQTFAPGEADTGAARLGWPPRRTGDATPCRPHPHARPLDRAGEPAAPGAALLESLERVSAQLFAGQDRVAVFQFSLESFRADDVHSLNPAAPEELHPFVNGLYAGTTGVLASRRMFQAGVRTAQGLAAMTCGVGTLPYNLSIIRDFENFPLRCAPDLLAEAGFEGRFFYGSDPHFDAMATFVQRHGVKELVTQDELPKDLPTGAWGGLTDFAVFDAAVQRVKDQPGSQYALVMSLSNHSPYTTPQDAPPFVPVRVDAALARVPHRGGVDDRRRLIANSYTDAALERFFRALDDAQLSERSIVVLLADHSTGEDYVWGPDSVEHETDEAKTLVPFLIVIPEAFLTRVADRPALEHALAEAQRQLEAQPLSQNDVPALLLALLHDHPGLRALPEEARWHTLGGQVTSPWFSAGDPESFLVGINGVDQLYTLDRQGKRVGAYEDAVFLRTRAERSSVTPRLIPVAATIVETMKAPVTCPK